MAERDLISRRNLRTLPLEIKQQIFRYVFDDVLPDLKLCMCCKSVANFSKRPHVVLLSVCHQLRHEALPVFHDVASQTRLNLKYETVPYHGRPRPMRCHRMLECYGHLFRDIIIDAEDATNFLAILPRFTGLRVLTVDYRSPAKGNACIVADFDGKEECLHAKTDMLFVQCWREIYKINRSNNREWMKIMYDLPGDRPGFRVQVLVAFDIEKFPGEELVSGPLIFPITPLNFFQGCPT